MSVWTEAMDAELRRLYGAGIPFSQCAPQISALGDVSVSRNAVIGRAHRLGLRRGPDYKQQARSPRARRTPSPPKSRPPAPARIAPEIVAEPVALRCVEVVSLKIGIADLNNQACHYPEGDGPFTFCGNPSKAGSPYCGPHHAICHTSAPARTRADGSRRGSRVSPITGAFDFEAA